MVNLDGQVGEALVGYVLGLQPPGSSPIDQHIAVHFIGEPDGRRRVS
jgi:hypothetical protein